MRPARRLAHRVIEGQAYVLDPRDTTLHRLNPTASLVWKMLAAGKSLDETARALAEEFEVPPERARRDASEFLDRLKASGLAEDS